MVNRDGDIVKEEYNNYYVVVIKRKKLFEIEREKLFQNSPMLGVSYTLHKNV